MKRVGAWCAALMLQLGLLLPLQAQEQPSAAEVAQEQRVAGLAGQLRCLVCQNQSLAESDAPLARDLKNRVREQVASGRSDEEIRAYMVARYGDFVLYQPPFKPQTWLLWLAPFGLLLAGVVALWLRTRRAQTSAPPSEAELQAATSLLEQGGEKQQ